MDYLRELSIKLGGKIKSQNHLNINFKEKSSRQVVTSNYKGYKIKINEFGELLLMHIYVESDFSFSINIPDSIFFFKKPSKLENVPYLIYESTESSSSFKDIYQNQFWKRFFGVMEELDFFKEEGVFIYKNCIGLALYFRRNLQLTLDKVIDLLDDENGLFKKKITKRLSSKNIPGNLRPVFPLIKKWAVSDDAERERLIETATRRQKKELIDTVDPLIKEINTFLDSFNDQSLSEEAILLGNLAELVSELKLRN